MLESITRDRMIKALHVEEGSWHIDDLRGAGEAFLASTTREIQAVASVDGRVFPAAPGPRTAGGPGGLRRTLGKQSCGSSEMDFQLSDEQKLIRETAREFAEREILPNVRDNDREGRFDRELARKLGEVGFLGAPIAEEYGGRGLDYIGYGLIAEEIGRADSSARTVVSVCTSLVAGPIEKWGTEEQKQKWLPRLCSGEALGCFGLTEPDTGSDAANLRTRATKTENGWSISGQKMWISLGNVSEFALIFAQTDPALKHRGLACFIVPTDSDGLHHPGDPRQARPALLRHRRTLARRGRGRRGRDAGEVGDGFKVAMSALENGRYSVAAGCVGICEGCVQCLGRLREGAQAVRRPPRPLPAGPGDDRRHDPEARRQPDAGPARRRC